MRHRAWLGWALIALSAVAVMGGDSECTIRADRDSIRIDADDDDDNWFEDLFDKRIPD